MASDTKYFKSNIHALAVVVGNPDPTKGEVAHPVVSFVPYWVKRLGEQGNGPDGAFKVGYLATDDGSALKKLSGDLNVSEITKKEYEDATTETFENGVQVGGLRAPY